MTEPRLTVCMIARNEEATIAKALDSLHWADTDPHPLAKPNADGLYPLWDELVIVLAGESTDNTEQVAKSYGATVAVYPPPDGRWPVDEASGRELRHYGDARAATEQLAHGDYVFWIDADERLLTGHELIRRIAAQGRLPGVRPHIKSLEGVVSTRQGLLHKRGAFRWRGAIHEWLEGMPLPVERGILYEEIPRPDGDRPHGDMFELLRGEMGDKLQPLQLFYLAREHVANGQWAEGLACSRLYLDSAPGYPERRSQVALYASQAWVELGDLYQARQAAIDALKEWGNWAEPYHALAVIHRDMGLFKEAIAWGTAGCLFEPGDETHNPEIYEWRRYDVMGYCLAQMGKFEHAAIYYEKVMENHPNDQTRINLDKCRRYAEERKKKVTA